MNMIFTTALFAGSALIGCWIAVRFPRLAPRSLMIRGAGALVVGQLLAFVPVASGSYLALYCSIFAVMLPILIAVWLQSVWVLMGLRDLLALSH